MFRSEALVYFFRNSFASQRMLNSKSQLFPTFFHHHLSSLLPLATTICGFTSQVACPDTTTSWVPPWAPPAEAQGRSGTVRAHLHGFGELDLTGCAITCLWSADPKPSSDRTPLPKPRLRVLRTWLGNGKELGER